MALDDSEVITDRDKGHMAYALCVLGTAATGGALGSLAGGLTLPGFVGGGVVGLFACKLVEQPLKRKLFSKRRMSDWEFQKLAWQTKRQFPQLSRTQVLDLIAESRMAALDRPKKYQC